MAELVQSQTGSSSAVQQASSSNSSSAFFSSSSSSSFSASSSSSASSTSSSSTKVVKQSVTSIKQSSSSSTMMSSSSSSSSKMVSIQSSGISYSDQLAVDLGIADVSKEMERLQLRLGDEMTNIHRDMFRLMPASPEVQTAAVDGTTTSTTGAGGLEQFLVKMDSDAIKSCIDKSHDDRVKLNFDVNEFDSETINIRTVGNKIEVHAMKKSKKGDEERSEEFSRVYELPNELDPSHVTSSIYKDGVLTIELPVTDALGTTQ